MAKKKLNKKVAVIGAIFMALIALAAIWVILYKLQGPQKFIEDANAAVAAKDYEGALKQYARALGRAKDNDTRKKILFLLADTHILNNDWRKTMACWNRVATIDTSDKVSRANMLDFYYSMADTGQYSAWKNVLTTSDELLAIAPEAKFYLAKGRAKLELAKGGEVVDRVQALDETIAVLKKARDLDTNNPLVYRYLAQAVEVRGEALAEKGKVEEKSKAQNQSQKLLERAIAVAPADPNTYIQLLNTKLLAAQDKKQIEALEADYLALTKKFPKSPDVFVSLSFYYKRDPNDIDKAIKAAQKAIELAPQSVKYAINAADVYYRKGSLTRDDKATQTGIEIAQHALTLPNAQDTQGPREYANKMNRLSLNTFLLQRYVEKIIDLPPGTPKEQKDALIAKAEQAVHEVSQIWGSGENPYVIAAEGELAYAKGDTMEGIRKMYTAYGQLKQSDSQFKDAQLGQLSYVLTAAFINSPEIGATRDFLYNSLRRNIYLVRPETLLVYAQITLQLRQYPETISMVDAYENIHQPTTTSQLLRARADIGAGQLDDAQTLLAEMKDDDPNVIVIKMSLLQTKIDQASAARADANQAKKEGGPIQAEIDKYRDEQVKLALKVLQSEPDTAQALRVICERYIAQDKIQEAKTVVNNVLARSPNNTLAHYYKVLLDEPDPAKATQQRREEISQQAAASMPDPVKRSLTFADYYRSKQMFDKAIAEYKKVLEAQPANEQAISGQFETALAAKDLSLAEQLSSVAKRENIDLCGGQVFAARVAIAKKDYKDALNRLDAVLKERPVFSVAYMLRSSVQAELGSEQLAIEDARKAVELNPLDGMAAKNFASLLYRRNLKLGTKVSAEQKAETQAAIERAYALNPGEWQLLSFYAEYISDTDPIRALSIRQRLQTAIPSVQNATLLGNLAVKMASEQKNAEQKKALMDIAANAYEQGYKMDPNNVQLLRGYADFYRLTARPEQATQLLSKASNKNLLWMNQIENGQYEQAKATLEPLYKKDPKDIDTLKGLLLASEGLNDAQSVTKYSQELLSLENTPDNQLGQIKAFLQVGLVEQAQKQLASFKEKNPGDNRIMILEAWLMTKKGQFTDALAVLNKSLELNPENSVAWHLRGQVDLARGNYQDAASDFKKAKAIMPSLQIRTDLARAYIRAGRGDDAINELVLAIDAEPGVSSTYFMLEQAYGQFGKLDALSRFYADTIKKFPTDPFWYNRAASFAISQKNFDVALSLSKSALELSQKSDPNMPRDIATQQARVALDNYLTVMRLKKQYDQLITYASQYVDSDLAYVALVQIADTKSELGDRSAAFNYYNKALLKAASEDVVVFNILKKMTATVGRDETVKWCTEQLKTTPDSLPINLALCNLMRMNNENSKALTYIDKCVQLVEPKSTAYRSFIDIKQSILLNAYNSTSDEKYFSSAIKLYEDFIANSSSVEVGAMNNLAFLLASHDRELDKAVSYAKKACDVVQNNPNILDTYAYVLYKNGDYTKASEVVQTAVQMFEKTSVSAPADVYQHVGMISAKLGRKNEALNAYKHALDIGEKTLSDTEKQRIKDAIESLN
jgi:tetratricopeptide (TPR) repeat protein